MRKILLATVSVVALGGAGLAFAAGTTNSNTGTGAGTAMPNAAGTTQPGYNTGTGTNMGTSTGTGAAGYNQGINANTGMTGNPNAGMTGTNESQWGGRMSRRDQVREVQQKLQADNLYNGKIDGVMGRETRQAVRSFQQQNGLRVNARLDRQTADAILGNGGTGQGSNMSSGTGAMPQTPRVPAR